MSDQTSPARILDSARAAAANEAAPPPSPTPTPSKAPARRRLPWGRLALFALVVAGGAFVAFHAPTRARVMEAIAPKHEPEAPKPPSPPRSFAHWDGIVDLTAAQARSISLEIAEVRPQDQPTRLEINGTTAYDPNTQVQIRPRFTSVIDRVYVTLGQQVKAGDPLVDLFSADLAAAKSDYEKAQARWQHDKGELARAEKLFHETPRAISEKEFLSIANDEKVSRAEAKVAADKLLVYGVSPDELPRVGDEVGTEKAKMTLLAPSGGVVIRKDVVRGNRYEDSDVLLVIAPLDHLWVWGNVYPADAAEVAIGQRWIVHCPTRDKDTPCEVESMTSEVAPDTKTVRIRSRIDNENGRLKANMLVSGYLEIPPSPGRTVIPRLAMVSVDGADYAFVAKPGPDGSSRFERREVRVAQEDHDKVILNEGLTPGERVATRGSLLLAQLYEDAAIVEPGAPD